MRPFLVRFQLAVAHLNETGAWSQDVLGNVKVVNPRDRLEALKAIRLLEEMLDVEKKNLVADVRSRGTEWTLVAKLTGMASADDARSLWGDKNELKAIQKAILDHQTAVKKKREADKGRFRPRLKPSALIGISVPDAAKALGTSTSTVYARCKRGDLESVSVPKTYSNGAWLRVVDLAAVAAHQNRMATVAPSSKKEL